MRNVYKEIQAPAFSKSFGSFKFLFAHSEWRRPLQLIVKKKSLVSKDVVSSVTSMFSLVKSWYDLQPVKSPESFQQSAWLVQNSYYEVDFENRFDPISMKWEENFYRSGLAYDKKFKEALFAIPSEHETSPPFRTRHGIHWVFYKKRYPAQNNSFEEIKDKLREKLSLSFRTRAFSAWMAGLRKKYSASITARSIR
ncbi:peptidyl-prolyl cis-trans isomerase [Myxococcota bacterium]|nr:peptidyl-prolyl cis-trans isomerase [Myxococcota bacterium]